MKQETFNKIIQTQILAQLLLENLEDLEGVNEVWKQRAKYFGKNALKAGEAMVETLTGSVGAVETHTYVECCKFVRERVEEIELKIDV